MLSCLVLLLKKRDGGRIKLPIHPSFNVHGTSTGGYLVADLDFQNQAVKTRFMYVSRFPGGKLVDADFSGIENRITAYLAEDTDRLGWLSRPIVSQSTSIWFRCSSTSRTTKSRRVTTRLHLMQSVSALCMARTTAWAPKISPNNTTWTSDIVKRYQAKWKAMIYKTSD